MELSRLLDALDHRNDHRRFRQHLSSVLSRTRYRTAEDGVRIAYRVEGDGPPVLLALALPSDR